MDYIIVPSFKSAIKNTDMQSELSWRQDGSFRVSEQQCIRALTSPKESGVNQCIVPFLHAALLSTARTTKAFTLLDSIAASALSPAVTGRTLACIADLLGFMSANQVPHPNLNPTLALIVT